MVKYKKSKHLNNVSNPVKKGAKINSLSFRNTILYYPLKPSKKLTYKEPEFLW